MAKAVLKTEPPQFKPVELTLTFESKEEFNSFKALWGKAHRYSELMYIENVRKSTSALAAAAVLEAAYEAMGDYID